MNYRQRTTRHPKILAITTATLLALGGATVGTATSSATPPPPPPDSVPVPPPPSAGEAAQIAADRTPNAAGFGPWTAAGADTRAYDPALPFSAIVLNVAGGTGSSPQQVALFDHGAYIGTTVPEAYPNQDVTRVADNIIQVDYRFPLPDDPNADPSGVSTSHYILYPQDIARTGALPPVGAVPPVQ
ncbi:MAG: LppP/LprE family lipoprotein [Mycobacteriaceae bacterium]|uniref:LppP/LprE family lipoprotein n=1 Tax=Corynebacterium sp. TaxID=1720 RepID=UPI003F976A47